MLSFCSRSILVAVVICLFSSDCRGQSPVTLRGSILEQGSFVPGRLYIKSADGKWFHARSAKSAGLQAVEYSKQRSESIVEIHTAMPADFFVAELPPGTYELTVERGKEYFPKTVTVEIPRQQAVEIEIERWVNMASEGWYSGDTHVHRSVEETKVPLLAEDLNVAFPLTYWVTDSHSSPVGATKSVKSAPTAKPIEVAPGHILYPMNTEYEIFTYGGKRDTLGAVFVIGHQTPLELSAPPVKPIADLAREQGALLDLDKHTWPWTPMIVPIMNVDLFELANNHIWRTEFLFRDWTIETLPDDWEIETDSEGGWTERGWIDFGFKTYYAFLNCGFDMKPTGGTAAGVHPVPLGFGRVYVHVDGEFTYEKWFAGLKAGNSFVTTGPMLTVTFDGKSPGTKFEVDPAGPIGCEVRGQVRSATPIDRIEIIVNGEVAETLKPQPVRQPNGSYTVSLDQKVSWDGSGWVAVRCFQPRENGRFFYAHTAPVHYRVPDAPLRPRLREVRYFLKRVNEEIARWRPVLKPEELAEYERAAEIYSRLLPSAR
ncbi:MAG TPA: CehA/McbA family metallohydrolase [Planctomycetaceae bacterium]|nr:CehA/McbA family metallohydrolase [Planctomycetaceae bacterium]